MSLLIHALFISCLLSSSLSLQTNEFTFQSRRSSSPGANITLFGDAYLRNSTISLTTGLNPTSFNAGRALYAYPLRFLDQNTNSPASFLTRFSFSILPSSPYSPFGDGLAFLITSNATCLGSSDGYLGLFNSSTIASTQETVIAVEFDTNLDITLGDINDNHVALDVNTIFSYASADAGFAGVDFKSGKILTAWIEYKNDKKRMRVWISYSKIRPTNPVLIAHIDLSKRFEEFMYVGFAASNGDGMAFHLIHRWRFRTFGFLSSQQSTDGSETGNGINGYEFFHHNQGTRIRKRKMDLGFLAGGVTALVISVSLIGWYLKRTMTRNGDRGGGNCRTYISGTDEIPARLSLAELRLATRGFDESRIVGQGASGTVYEGVLSSGKAVAVKRFGVAGNCLRSTFDSELAAVAGCLKHRNLVPLHGWCCDRGELLLIYEYMPNGSLDRVLHPTSSASSANLASLSWAKRLKIVLDVAAALAYLHDECEQQIIHRDVKTCNIMLDSEFNAKLGDFGLAHLSEHDGPPRPTLPAGTIGYLAPEYVHSGLPTEKTDVYGFGVVALEVVTGKRPIESGLVLVDLVWEMWGKGKLVEVADARLNGRFGRSDMDKVLIVGLSCVHPDCNQRPSMKEALGMLKGEVALPVLPMQKPMVRLTSLLPENFREVGRGGSGGAAATGSSDEASTIWATPCTSFGQIEEVSKAA